MFTELLLGCCERKELVEVYSDKHAPDKFHVGYVMASNGDFCAMQLVSPEGFSDGYIIEVVDAIFKVNTGTTYIKKMQTLMKYRNTKASPIPVDMSNPVQSFLDYAKSTGSLVSVELFESAGIDAQGFVEGLEPDLCTIRQVDNFGESAGMCYILYDDISQVTMNGQEETILEILHSEYYK